MGMQNIPLHIPEYRDTGYDPQENPDLDPTLGKKPNPDVTWSNTLFVVLLFLDEFVWFKYFRYFLISKIFLNNYSFWIRVFKVEWVRIRELPVYRAYAV